MSVRSFRAWKFAFPDDSIEEPARRPPCGLSLTLGGGAEMIEGNASIRQSLLMLLSISPGERVMFPEYGCNLRKLAFEENDDTTAGLAIHYVREAVRRWEPRVHIIRLDARADREEPSRLDIILEYRPVHSLQTDRLEYSIDLGRKEL